MAPTGKRPAHFDTQVIYCGDCLDQLRKLPDACVDLNEQFAQKLA